jgi:hypothetical protein
MDWLDYDASATAEQISAGMVDFRQIKSASDSQLAKKLRLGMLVYGVGIFSWPGAPTSAVHDSEDLERTVEAFQRTIRIMKQEGDV